MDTPTPNVLQSENAHVIIFQIYKKFYPYI